MGITIKDIAAQAEVSITTVSKILNHKADSISQATIDRVMRIVEENKYSPNSVARSMITKTTKSLGLILPDISNLYFAGMARGVEDKASEHGYNVIFCNTNDQNDKEQECISMLRDKLVDGIILIPTLFSDKERMRISMKAIKYYVLLDRIFDADREDMNCVYSDNVEGGYIATRHLLESGHKRIACVTGPGTDKSARDRLKGYKKALEEAGIIIQEDWIMEENYRLSGGMRAGRRLLESNVEAVFVQNDLMACGVYHVYQEAGKIIPQDLSIVGYDNVDYSRILSPALTTVSQPYQEMGWAAADILIAQIEKREHVPVITYTPSLKVRGSVAKKRSTGKQANRY